MENKIVGAQSQSALNLATECDYGFLQELGCGAAHVYQVAGVYRQRCYATFLSQAFHLFRLRSAYLDGLPLAWARRKYLQRIAAESVGAFSGFVDATGSRGMNADLQPRELGR